MAKYLLSLVSIFRPLLNGNGIDFNSMMVIVETKLLMDQRRVYMNWRQGRTKENTNHLRVALLFYGFMGLVMGSMIFFVDNFLTIMIFTHAYVLFMMAMILITDFSSVLLDTTDNQVILPRPVNSKTLFLARLVHILLYLLQFTFAITAGSWLFTFLKYGLITGLALIFTTLFTVLLAIFITYFLYLAILHFSNEQRIREIITYFQIFMMVFFTLGLQVFPRLLNVIDVTQAIDLKGYMFAFPPVWMALTVDAFRLMQFDAVHIVMLVLSILVPIAGFWVLFNFLAPGFASRLSALQGTANVVKRKEDRVDKIERGSLSESISAIACNTAVEKGSFAFTWKITGRDRNFRMQFYPGLAYILVFFFIFVLRGNKSIAENWQQLPETNNYLWLIYLSMLSVSSSLTLVAFNESYGASWIYHSTPVQQPGEIILGTIKSLFIKFFIPIYLILFTIAVSIWGWQVADDFLLGFFNNLFCFLVLASLTDHYLPFSRQPDTKQQAGRFMVILVQFILVGGLVGLHYLLINRTLLFYVIIPILIQGIVLLLQKLRTLSWSKISI
jgi:ABC-2 type transport system permease protein